MLNSSTRRAPRTIARDTIRFRPSVGADADGIRRLLRATPFGGRISLTLEADPDHREELCGAGRRQIVVAARESAPDEILGLAERAGHTLWVDRESTRIGYLAQLRRMPGEKITLRRMRYGYDLLERERQPDELPFDYTSILAENASARRLLERGLPGLPRYEEVGKMVTLTFAVSSYHNSKGPPSDVVELHRDGREEALDCLRRNLQQRQLAPDLEMSAFDLPGITWLVSKKGGKIDGCVALWDQRAFKAVTIHGYAGCLRRLRIPINLMRAARGLPTLPPIGGRLPLAFLAFLVADGDDCDVMASLVTAACAAAKAKSLSYVSLGLPDGHHLLPVFKKKLRPDMIESVIYLVHPSEAARDSTAGLDAELRVFPEIALL